MQDHNLNLKIYEEYSKVMSDLESAAITAEVAFDLLNKLNTEIGGGKFHVLPLEELKVIYGCKKEPTADNENSEDNETSSNYEESSDGGDSFN